MPEYIVQVGLTRRLVNANSQDDAKQEFISDRLMRSFLGDLGEDVTVHVASDLEIAEFARPKRKRPIFDDQTALELDDVRSGYGSDKEHA